MTFPLTFVEQRRLSIYFNNHYLTEYQIGKVMFLIKNKQTKYYIIYVFNKINSQNIKLIWYLIKQLTKYQIVYFNNNDFSQILRA